MKEQRKRIAVIVPANRLWIWQRQAILRLTWNYDVDQYYTDVAPPYPKALRNWLYFEREALGQALIVQQALIQCEKRWVGPTTRYDIILNLSEAPISHLDSTVADLKYDGSLDSVSLMTALLMQKSPYLSVHSSDREEPVATSYLNVSDKVVLQRGLQVAFARLVLLVERAAKHIADGTTAANPSLLIRKAFPFTRTLFARYCACFFADKLVFSFVRKLQIKEYWSLAIFRYIDEHQADLSDPAVIKRSKLIQIHDDGRRFFADPFLFEENGQTWIFAEEFPYATNKGVISCFNLSEDGKVSPLGVVLERPYHISYPFVFRSGDDIFMLPETGGSKNVELYRAESFPDKWTLQRILLPGIELYDGTLFERDGKWWLFGTTSLDGNFPQDELAIFFSDHLEGPWQPHPWNPVKSDCRSARPAGRIVVQSGRILRPAQDCESDYGSGIVWCEITELTTGTFKEKEVGRWGGEQINAGGLHSFDHAGKWAIIDIKRTVWKKLMKQSGARDSSRDLAVRL